MTELEERVLTNASAAITDMKLEVVIIPASDVDRAKEFYSRLGWRLDADRSAGDAFRLVQFTPPASGSSIVFVRRTAARSIPRRHEPIVVAMSFAPAP